MLMTSCCRREGALGTKDRGVDTRGDPTSKLWLFILKDDRFLSTRATLWIVP